MKTSRSNLSSVSVPDSAAAAFGTALKLSAKNAKKLSPVQQAFNRLLARVDKLKAQVADMQTLADTSLSLYQSTIVPLNDKRLSMLGRMAWLLDERLSRKGLTPTQKRQTVEYLCQLCENLIGRGDKSFVALHDKHSSLSLREKAEERAEMMKGVVENMFGTKLDIDEIDEIGQDLEDDDSLAPFEKILRAGQAHMEKVTLKAQAEFENSQTQKKKKPSAAQRKAEQQQVDADTVLRQVYRQLASALHPDRERDPAEQKRKTDLMSEANAAYARQDLVALLHLQLRIAQTDTQDLLQQPAERIAAMSLLLKQQVAELEDEFWAIQENLEQRLGMDMDMQFDQALSATDIKRYLVWLEGDLKQSLQEMEADLEKIPTNDAFFKGWLKAQVRPSKEVDYF